jgi:hypothetical protein
MFSKKSISLVLCLISLSVCSNGLAEKLLYKVAEENRAASLKTGISRDSLNLLEIEPGPGQHEAIGKMLEGLSLSGEYTLHTEGVSSLCTGNGWRVYAQGDGTRITYFNERAEKSASLTRNGPLTDESALSLGSKTIAKLSGLIQIENGQAVVPYMRKQHIITNYALDGKEISSAVIGTLLYFKRVIDGMLVVGPGSTISMEINNDGEIVYLSSDWPRYSKSDIFQNQLSMESFVDRARTYNDVRWNSDYYKMTKMECGYYDRGFRRDSFSYIQPACVMSFDGSIDDGNLYSTSNAVPTGETVEYDAVWNEAGAIAENGELCMETPVGKDDFDIQVDPANQ